MTAAHSQSMRQALATLAQEKDSVLSRARQSWEREQSTMKERVKQVPF